MSLIDRRQGATLQHIVDECGVCPRTVYRDIEALAEGELTVFFDPQTHSYRFTEKVFLQPLTFSLEEATALVQVIQGLSKSNTPLRSSLRQAQEKIMACLPQDRQKKVEEGRRAVDVRLVNQPAEVCRDIFGCVLCRQLVHRAGRTGESSAAVLPGGGALGEGCPFPRFAAAGGTAGRRIDVRSDGSGHARNHPMDPRLRRRRRSAGSAGSAADGGGCGPADGRDVRRAGRLTE